MLKYNQISALVNIEEQRQTMLWKMQSLMDFLNPNIKDTSSDKKELLMLMIQDIIVSENDLSEQIAEVIEN